MWVFKDALPYLLGPATNTFCELMLLDGDVQENEGLAASSDRWASSMQARCSTHGVDFMMMDNKVSYIYVVHIALPTILFYPCLAFLILPCLLPFLALPLFLPCSALLYVASVGFGLPFLAYPCLV